MYFQFPTVEECDFHRQFLFDEYTANCIKVVLRQSEKVKAKREKYDGSD
jgi:hypothetical protein